MPERAEITAAVLAGGQGRRMGGVDKGLVEVAGRPLIAWTLQALQPQAGAVMINANRSLDVYRSFGFPVVQDRHAGFQGPLAGLHAVLAAAESPWVLTVPCDAPRVPPDLAARLGRALEEADAELAAAEAGGRLHSLHALVSRDLLEDLTAELEAGRRKPDAWYATRRWVRVAFDDQPKSFANINTPEERDRLAAELQGAD